MPGIFCLFFSFLSRCGSPSDTRWCNTSKEIYILNRCWSQTSCYGAVCFVQYLVKFAYVFRPFSHMTRIFRRRVAECKSCCFDGVAGLAPHHVRWYQLMNPIESSTPTHLTGQKRTCPENTANGTRSKSTESTLKVATDVFGLCGVLEWRT